MKIILDEKTICDLECLLDGYFEPVNSFMNKKQWKSVCENLHLDSGEFFPLPIMLAVSKEILEKKECPKLILCDSTNYPLAELHVTNFFKPDIDWECEKTLGTNDLNHPYVKYKHSHKDKFNKNVNLKKINDIRHYDFNKLRLKPSDTKKIFEGIKTVVGFQTRNPLHRAHYELTKYALSKTGDNDAKLFINPVVGETQSVDIDYHIRVNCYKELLNEYQNTDVTLGLLPLAMRMAGPREACLHALIRKNYGCTHFVVGRDHAGPSFKTKEGNSFYGPYEAQDLFVKYADEIGIKPIFSKMIVYNKTKGIYQPIDEVDKECEVSKLSGTQFREMLQNNKEIPSWFSFKSIIKILQKSVKKRGICYYFIGLSGSGKTTYTNILKQKLLEKNPSREITILDGDIVRQELSKGLGFSKEDRSTNVQRIGYVASEIVKHGGIVICANIAPYDKDRLVNRKKIEDIGGKYIEILVNTPLEICEKRDVKNLYKLARQGIIKQFTGISDPFEYPSNVDYIINIDDENTMDKLLEQ
jgi:sulfate adenylyltransferase